LRSLGRKGLSAGFSLVGFVGRRKCASPVGKKKGHNAKRGEEKSWKKVKRTFSRTSARRMPFATKAALGEKEKEGVLSFDGLGRERKGGGTAPTRRGKGLRGTRSNHVHPELVRRRGRSRGAKSLAVKGWRRREGGGRRREGKSSGFPALLLAHQNRWQLFKGTLFEKRSARNPEDVAPANVCS